MICWIIARDRILQSIENLIEYLPKHKQGRKHENFKRKFHSQLYVVESRNPN